jgi:hypothetical protein
VLPGQWHAVAGNDGFSWKTLAAELGRDHYY